MITGTKIPFSRVLVTIEPGCSLLTVPYHELFDIKYWFCVFPPPHV